MIYLDNSATTKIDPRVLKAMLPYLQEEYGNPSAKYYTLAENAKRAVEKSRENLAKLINCEPDELIFTSGASESNNFILKGIADFYSNKGNHIITSLVEHSSILETCNYLESKGFEVTYLGVNQYGQVDPNELKKVITKKTILVSIIWGNNEIGTLNKIKEIGQICREHNVFFHSDATQVLGKIKIDVQDVPVDFLSFSAHKLYGPKGIGACFIRKDELGLKREITPLIHGGGQEFGYRAGTLCTHNIVGFGKAAEIAYNEMDNYIPNIIKLENELKAKLESEIKGIKFNGHPIEKIPGILSVTIPGVNNELLIRKLKNQVAFSTGSACSFNKPSKVLLAIGMNLKEIRNTIRISIGKFNSDIQKIPELIKSC
ncbi:cysteine desulfurase DndA [Anoxybacter fermentans]|uniref:cysteine desulfurase n=1 Tax=Anoxybacter fermentans TaxID=1323375 RepID=A0A3Q9HNR4_9FIRM|nr:cysteine desulfurase family protein [Anoxybacter fermentans]AZR72162.1 cysteine desulfurase DndA [Anoxybacter fermentans]